MVLRQLYSLGDQVDAIPIYRDVLSIDGVSSLYNAFFLHILEYKASNNDYAKLTSFYNLHKQLYKSALPWGDMCKMSLDVYT